MEKRIEKKRDDIKWERKEDASQFTYLTRTHVQYSKAQ